jgi:hypothetical protein
VNAVERAAAVLRQQTGLGPMATEVAQAIADLLLTDADQAVLDAAREWEHQRSNCRVSDFVNNDLAEAALLAAVRALEAQR